MRDDAGRSAGRASLIYVGLGLVTILAGLALRLIPLGVPASIVKWGGSVLWAAMVYWIFAALLPSCRVTTVAVASGVFAALVELTRLYHSPGLDAFRITLAGKLLLGRVFSYEHFLVYWGTIGLAAWVDRKWLFLRDARQTNLPS